MVLKMEGSQVTVVNVEFNRRNELEKALLWVRTPEEGVVPVEFTRDPQVRGLLNGRRPEKSEHQVSVYMQSHGSLKGVRFCANYLPQEGFLLVHDLEASQTYRTQIPRG